MVSNIPWKTEHLKKKAESERAALEDEKKTR